MSEIVYFILALPVTAALVTSLAPHRRLLTAARVSTAFSGGALVAAIALVIMVSGETPTLLGIAGTPLALYVDPLSALMAAAVAAISLIVHVYSIRYMADDPGYGRFFVMLDIMTVVILVMVTAGDLILLLAAWHLVGVLLYLLLSHDFTRDAVIRHAVPTFITHRLGDLPLLLAVVLLYQAYDTTRLPDLFARMAEQPDVATAFGLPLMGVTACLVLLSAFAKSAQFPLHTWLPYSMEGPTPVSALMHAGIVNAGGFLINRFAPVFLHSGDVLQMAFAVGLITAIIGSILMLAQSDIKKSLGYSTMGQMGYMVMECGLGAFSLAIYHLIAHGVFKATLFLGSGSVIHAARKDDGVPPDEVYRFVVEREAPPQRLPWFAFIGISILAPLAIVVLAHWLVESDFFRHEGAIVLLFFGWITGAQTLFATHRLASANPWKTFAFAILSFAIVVLGYVLIGHAFDAFLYPDAAFRDALYETAGIGLLTFDVLVALLTVVVVIGWLMNYYATFGDRRWQKRLDAGYARAYAHIAREFYLGDAYRWLSRVGNNFSARLDTILRRV